eukprot:c29134_g2_i1 orf=578-1030(+)
MRKEDEPLPKLQLQKEDNARRPEAARTTRIEQMADSINNQLKVLNWAGVNQELIHKLYTILYMEGWWGSDDTPADSVSIMRRILQHCEEEKTWQRSRHDGNMEARNQWTIADLLNGESKKKTSEMAKFAISHEAMEERRAPLFASLLESG